MDEAFNAEHNEEIERAKKKEKRMKKKLDIFTGVALGVFVIVAWETVWWLGLLSTILIGYWLLWDFRKYVPYNAQIKKPPLK